MIESAEPHGFDGVVRAGEGGEHRDRRRVFARPNAPQHFDSIQSARHAQIEQHGIDAASGDKRQRIAAGRGQVRAIAEIGDGFSQPVAYGIIVVDDQDGRHGSSISKTVPEGAEETRRASPPWARAISRAMASPRPVPSARAVTKGSKSRSRISPATPGPVSLTRRWRLPLVSAAATVTVPPRGVFCTALRIKLSKARRIWSISKSGGVGASGTAAASTVTPLAAASSRCASVAFFKKLSRSASTGFGSRRCVMARRSRNNASSLPTCSRIDCSADARRPSSPETIAFSALSRMAAIGLRISCARPAANRPTAASRSAALRSEEHTSELQSLTNLVCRLLLEKKKQNKKQTELIKRGKHERA